MKQSELQILLREGEGSMLEYKESFSSSLAREFAAFANSTGGKILLGVRDDGTLVGMEVSSEMRARIEDIARNCDPPVKVLMEKGPSGFSVGKCLAIWAKPVLQSGTDSPLEAHETLGSFYDYRRLSTPDPV